MSDATVEPRSLSAEAIFISHATADKDFVRVLVRQLKQKGFEVWHQDEMAVGRNYMAEIDARLDSCKAGIVVWSRASVSSEYVIAEANRLRERRRLVPVYIEECKPPIVFALIQGVKCYNQRSVPDDGMRDLCSAINKLIGTSNVAVNNAKNDWWVMFSTSIHRALSQNKLSSIFYGTIFGFFFSYSLFKWHHVVPEEYVDEFKNSSVVPAAEAKLTLESEFQESVKPISVAMTRSETMTELYLLLRLGRNTI